MSEVKVNKITPRTNCGTTTLGDSGDTFNIPAGVTISNNGTATGFGATGAVNWDVSSIKTVTFTATAGVGYFVDTATTGAVTVNLPAGTAGDVIGVADYAQNFASANCILAPNGTEKIGGEVIDSSLDTNGLAVTLVYVDASKGWVVTDSGLASDVPGPTYIAATGGCITTCGNCKMHTFLSPGTFTVSTIAGCATDNQVSYMVVAGGGGGGNGCTGGGGGGAGGYREVVSPSSPYTGSPTQGYATPGNIITVTATSYPIGVGGGGASVSAGSIGNNGDNSTFSTITSTGGGGGGRWSTGGAASGGSGGGQAKCGAPTAGGVGNSPPTTPAQGSDGGGKGYYQQGGGGGATAVGQDGNNPPSPATRSPTEGNGGTGATSSINGTPTERAGGGAGGYASATPVPGAGKATATGGGSQGGGQGSDATNATVNTGGGGGGAGNPSSSASGAGGSGIVIIRYKYQ